jgi:hypothetical protein
MWVLPHAKRITSIDNQCISYRNIQYALRNTTFKIIITGLLYSKFCSNEIKKLLPTSPGSCSIFK